MSMFNKLKAMRARMGVHPQAEQESPAAVVDTSSAASMWDLVSEPDDLDIDLFSPDDGAPVPARDETPAPVAAAPQPAPAAPAPAPKAEAPAPKPEPEPAPVARTPVAPPPEPVKVEPVKAEVPRVEAPKIAEPPKPEPPRAEAPKVETPKAEPPAAPEKPSGIAAYYNRVREEAAPAPRVEPRVEIPARAPEPPAARPEPKQPEPVMRAPEPAPVPPPAPKPEPVAKAPEPEAPPTRSFVLSERAKPEPEPEPAPAPVRAVPVIDPEELAPLKPTAKVAEPVEEKPRRTGRVKTRLIGFDKSSGGMVEVADPENRPAVPAAVQSEPTFPVGWLVVVEGAGRGATFMLGPGVAQIGRDEGQAVQLDFGDATISRANHASIAFDDEARSFFIGHGGKSNIVRLNGKPVLSTETMKNGDLIRIGETSLRLVALCNEGFSWADELEENKKNNG